MSRVGGRALLATLGGFVLLAPVLGGCDDDKPSGVAEDRGDDDNNNNDVIGDDPGCPGGCDDGNPCTVDSCRQGLCRQEPQDQLCDDGNPCTVDACDRQLGCTSVVQPDACDDGVACTADSCDPAAGCQHRPVDEGCDDGVACTADTCDAQQGCVHTPEAERCDDGIDCTVDACDAQQGGCVHTPDDGLCDDGVGCTVDTCDVDQGGCANATDDAVCDDGDPCTSARCDAQARVCVIGDRDEDRDGQVDVACGGVDCDDANPRVGEGFEEVCNGLDDNCDGSVDEGVVSQCGNCDLSCFRRAFGVDEQDERFPEEGMFGVSIDDERGGLVAESLSRRFNFLWVTNTNESTVSRWDADTGQEIGRYRVGLPEGECPNQCCWSGPCNMPSRVGVDGRGDAYVANRGFGMQGTVTKIAADISDCQDRNNNGMIDTSVDRVALGWGEDECVLWTAPVGPSNAVLRGLAVDLGDNDRPEGYVWAGGYNTRMWWKIDPRTGQVLAEVAVPVQPYGGVVTADGKLWTGILSGTGTAYVDTTTLTASPLIPFPSALRNNCQGSYGITADGHGRVWFTGWSCRDAMGYDPQLQAWTRVDTTAYGHSAGRGITVDANNRVWMAMEGGGRSHISTWASDAFVPNGVIPQAQTALYTTPPGHTGPSGVGADANGRIWLAHHGSSQLVRFDPDDLTMESFIGPNKVYTYSDFTGQVRRTITGEGIFQQDFEAECDRPDWDALIWDAETPEGTRLVITAYTAESSAALDRARAIEVAVQPGAAPPVVISPALFEQGQPSLRVLRLVFRLEVNEETSESPVLRSFDLQWFCK